MFVETKKYGKWVLLGSGVLGAAFMIVSIVFALNSVTAAYAHDVFSGTYDNIFKAQILGPAVQAGQIDQATMQGLIQTPVSSWPTAFASAFHTNIDPLKAQAFYGYFQRVVELVMQIVVFGLLPLLYAVKKVVNKHEIHVEKKVETKEVKAEPVKAEPAKAEPAKTAPKPVAKPAAKPAAKSTKK